MNPNSVPFPPHLLSQAVWLRVALSGRFNAEQVQRWHRRLQAYLTARGLVAAISPQRIAIVRTPDGHPKLLHSWPPKLLQAGRNDYAGSAVMTKRAAASLSR
jgi:hypothetical protein